MVSLMNATPVFLFVLSLSGAEGIVDGKQVLVADRIQSDCYRSGFIESQAATCFQQQGLASLKFPWDSKFLSFVDSIASSFEEEECGQRLTEAYHCFYNSCRDCFDQFYAEAVKSGNSDLRSDLQDMELYIPDPDLFRDAILVICEAEEEVFSCFDDKIASQQLLCGLQELLKMFSPRSHTSFKPVVCRTFEGLQQCTLNYTTGCPQKTVSFLHTVLSKLRPPGCQNEGITRSTTGTDQNKASQEKSRHFHDET